jgi:hypothetical protein
MKPQNRNFLYISPHFAPNSRVGAMRPLKFIRHIEKFGWTPIIFCGFDPKADLDTSLLDFIPRNIAVHRTYNENNIPSSILLDYLTTIRPEYIRPKQFRSGINWFNPELIPMGGDIFQIPKALRNGRKVLMNTPCKAIMVNSDPYAAAYVGYKLSIEFNIPLIIDFRDPWSVCELRSPMRPFFTRISVRFIESKIMNRASKIVLNTKEALSDYRKQYRNIISKKFTYLYNFNDTTMFNTVENPTSVKNTPKKMIYMGNFRRFINGKELFEILNILKERGYTENHIRLSIFGNFPEESLRLATSFGVMPYLELHKPVPYADIVTYLESSDLLTLIMNKTRQRLPAKFFDYICSTKPILAISDNPELNELVNNNFGKSFNFSELNKAADMIEHLIQETLVIESNRNNPYTASEASKQLSNILDESVSIFQ